MLFARRLLFAVLIANSCLSTSTAAWFGPEPALVDAAAAELGAPAGVVAAPAAQQWNPSRLRLRRTLSGRGFHRTLSIQIWAEVPSDGGSSSDGGGGGRRGAKAAAGCRAALLQPLPSGLFADPYQLDDLARGRDLPRFSVLGPLDLELPAPACEPTLLLADLGPGSPAEDGGANWEVEVPLHAKYPTPVHTGFSGWRWLLSGMVDVEVPPPWVVMHCPGGGAETLAAATAAAADHSEQQQEQGVEDEQQQQQQAAATPPVGAEGWVALQPPAAGVERVLWAVPAGSLDHDTAVALVTTAVSAACSGAVVWAALRAARRGGGGKPGDKQL